MTQVRTVDGRIAGSRGQATRTKLLESLAEMITTTGYRDVTVIDVARVANTSPATFYQYFPDIQAAVVELANEAVKEGGALRELAAERNWSGKAGAAAASELVDGFLDFWHKHEVILRVVDLGAAEGDRRFVRIRTKLLGLVVAPLTDAIAQLQKNGRIDADVLPAATASALVTMLAASATHTKTFDGWSVRDGELRTGLARLVTWGVTGKKPSA
jgi:AcrR family transcriptional regulator